MSADESIPVLPPTPSRDGRPHVYVLNSDPGFLEMIAELLEDVHLNVTLEQLRPNVEVTLDNLHSAQPDLVILDVVPHQRNAAVLLKYMERDDDLRHIPVLVASASPRIAEALAAEHTGLVQDVLRKPFDLTDFYATLSRLVVGIAIH